MNSVTLATVDARATIEAHVVELDGDPIGIAVRTESKLTFYTSGPEFETIHGQTFRDFERLTSGVRTAIPLARRHPRYWQRALRLA